MSLRCFLLFLPIRGRFKCPSTWVHSVCLKLIHSPAVRLVLSLDTIWLLTRFSELQLDLASLGGMWPPLLAQLLSPVSAWIRSTSCDGQKQISLFFLFQMYTVFSPPSAFVVSLRDTPSIPTSLSGRDAVMLLNDVVLLFHLNSRSPNQHLLGLQFWGMAVQNIILPL